ncbi:S9 family peptidase [Tahibacter amnicola]|uniref:S9 family peptidase n=1 Tax=Tahibacter amnicola TaxID=2976241 RepID=A0ABY6BEH7_9GAMM|nr:S9 family peptidase [Tahibacter amnicola]UXI68433.1 S9 family peptidase [Tahibacter amnicola]
MRTMLFTGLMALSLPAMSEKLTIERLLDDPALLGTTPRGLKISPDGSRVSFLRGKESDQNTMDLWEYNLADNTTRLLVDSRAVQPQEEELSDAEKATRERMRIASLKGIVSYRWSPDGRQLLFPLGGQLYLYDLGAKADQAVRSLTPKDAEVMDPQVAPSGRYVSYVSKQNLWVVDVKSGENRALTTDGKDSVHNGEAEFVAQEEMERFTGYWWSPTGDWIAFERYDEIDVPIVQRFEINADRTNITEQRYPTTGKANVRVKLGLIRPDAPANTAPTWIDLGPEEDIYLTRVNWTPDGKSVTFQRQSRDQKTLDLVRVDVQTLKQQVLLTETSKTWINLHDDLKFLKDDAGFIWASERSGQKHLYLYGMDGKEKVPLTRGDWHVDRVLAVDEAQGRVYFAGNKDHPLDKQVYAVKLDGSDAAAPQRITREDGWHEATFAADDSGKGVKLFVDSWSDPKTPSQVSVRAPDGKHLAWIAENKVDDKHPYGPYRAAHITPEFGTLTAKDGQTLWYRLLKPSGFDPSRRYPVVSHFYGGPTAQLATRGFPDVFDEYLAQHGYVVITLDNRGMARRGRAFSDAIYRQTGAAEVEDQRVAIEWLARQPWVDGKRIGVFGWSYGGYMALMMLAKASDVVAAGVSVAPVTDFSLYDTHYTERYLGTPQQNPEGYTKSSIFPWLDGMTSPLLLIHGMADDNVLFTNSTQLMAELQNRGKAFDLMTYPGGKHGMSTPAMKKHVYNTIVRWLDRQLKNDAAAPAAGKKS